MHWTSRLGATDWPTPISNRAAKEAVARDVEAAQMQAELDEVI